MKDMDVMNSQTPQSRVSPSSLVWLLDQVRDRLRVAHYYLRTWAAYVDWIRRYILLHGKRDPAELGARDVGRFLTHLAVDRSLSASRGGAQRDNLFEHDGYRQELLVGADLRRAVAGWRNLPAQCVVVVNQYRTQSQGFLRPCRAAIHH